MASIAIIANGTLFKKGDSASPEVFTTVPEVMRLGGPTIRFDLLDVTSHDTVGFFREFIPGLADGERVAATVNWRPSNTIHKGIRVDSYARTLRNYRLVFPDTPDNTVTMATYTEAIAPKADIGTVLVADITVKITGAPVWT